MEAPYRYHPLLFYVPYRCQTSDFLCWADDELAEIGERLSDPNCRFLTLVGPGGMGKTRLAIAVGEAQQFAFIDGVTFVPLAAITDTTLSLTPLLVACVGSARFGRRTSHGLFSSSQLATDTGQL